MQRLDHTAGVQRGGAHVDEPDAVVTLGPHGGHTDDGPVLGPTVELLERPAERVELGDADLGEQFVGLEIGLEEPGVELADGDLALTAGALHDECAAEGEHHGREIGGGIGVGQRAANRAAMADLGIAHMAGGVMEQGSGAAEQFAGLEIAMAGERTDGDVISGIADEAEIVEAADVDQHRG